MRELPEETMEDEKLRKYEDRDEISEENNKMKKIMMIKKKKRKTKIAITKGLIWKEMLK